MNVSQQVVLSVSGPAGAELHLSGFFEPQREGDDEGMFMDGEDDEDLEDEDISDEDEKAGKKLNQSL